MKIKILKIIAIIIIALIPSIALQSLASKKTKDELDSIEELLGANTIKTQNISVRHLTCTLLVKPKDINRILNPIFFPALNRRSEALRANFLFSSDASPPCNKYRINHVLIVYRL
jgi:hypothetical protein